MILKGSQRAGGAALAAHLMNDHDNDHVRIADLRGFVSDDLHGAFKETQAIASGTQCKQYLFSLSLNPPKGADVSEADFIKAADEAEKALGLEGQPRAMVFHEKEGRRHAHVVWSRIDAQEMRAINMAHFKNKLTSLSRDLYLEHGWQLPDGLRPDGLRNPFNYTLDEWQRAKRNGVNPQEIKQVFRDAWNRSDGQKAFAGALSEYGYFLAKGDRRGFVAVDVNGDVYSVAKYAGVTAKDVRFKLGTPDALPSVSEVSADLKGRVTAQVKGFIKDVKAKQAAERAPLEAKRDAMRALHRSERAQLKTKQEARWQQETDARAGRLRTGLGGLWDNVSGRAKSIKAENEREAFAGLKRDQAQRDGLILEQSRERRALQKEFDQLRARHAGERKIMARDVTTALRRKAHHQDVVGQAKHQRPDPEHGRRNRGFTLDR
jgi:hypothetical protein